MFSPKVFLIFLAVGTLSMAAPLPQTMSGFDRALAFATTALTTGQRVELATESAGVGIIISAGVNNGGGTARAEGTAAEGNKPA